MLDMWTDFIRHMAIISFFLITATVLRSKIKFLQIFYVPNSIIAGFLGLALSYQVLTLLPIPDNILHYITIPPEKLKDYIYHFLGITFIALTLKKSNKVKGINAFNTNLMFAIGYGIQAFIGFGLALIIFSKIYPKFNPASGVLVQLGFSNSPSLANNIARGWEKLLIETPNLGKSFAMESGISYSGDIGLTFGAIGFLIASIAGIILIRYGVKKGYIFNLKNNREIDPMIKKGYVADVEKQKNAGKLTTMPEAIDSFALHIAVVLILYILTFAFLKAFLYGLTFLPDGVGFLAKVIVNFHFIIGALFAMIVKKIMRLIKIDFLIDNGISARIAGTCVDYMVTAALAAISIVIVIKFIIPIIVISSAAGIATFLYCAYLGSRSFDTYKYERIVSIFGIATGTMATGMALLRVMDPEFKTPVASEIMYGSGIVFFFTMPIMILINLPLKALVTGNNFLNWLALILVGVYVLAVIIIWILTRVVFNSDKIKWNRLWDIESE